MAVEAIKGAGGHAIAEPLQRWPDSWGATVAFIEQLHSIWEHQPSQGDALLQRGDLAGHSVRGRLLVRRHPCVDGGVEQVHEAFLLPTGCVCSASPCAAGSLWTTVRHGHGTMCAYACATHAGVPRCGANVTRTFSTVGCRGSRRAMTASWLPCGERSLEAPVLEWGASKPVTI